MVFTSNLPYFSFKIVSPQTSPLTSLQPSPELSGLEGNPDQRLDHILLEGLVNLFVLDTFA